ncbi:diguanylate cyclase [Novosphingobium sp.]|uniref:GGDEF domain-containing protein n=1 Tax=Novosphingobium sp. TaxID=1874826 RepID=UPI00334040D4
MAIGLLYLGGMMFSCVLGRLDGGVAMIWVPGALLAAVLSVCDRAVWLPALAVCGLANVLGSAWFGLGWLTGAALAPVNLGEAVAVALLSRYSWRAHWPGASFEMVSTFLLGTILVIPGVGALVAAALVHGLTGQGFVSTFQHWMLGHAAGLVAVLPFALMCARRITLRAGPGSVRRRASDPAPAAIPATRGSRLLSLLMVLTMALLVLCVFVQDSRWPLAAPVLFALFVAVWADALLATAMPMLVALIAAPLTAAGWGPIAPGVVLAGDRLQLGLIYAVLVACCCLPVVAEQARRRHEINRLSRSAAHFQAMSQNADTLIDELRRAALTDPLTGLPNRRAFFEALAAQAQSGERACVAMIDIDHFKQVNDRFGHATGDAVLREFADIAKACFRASDMVGRIGGEEFAVILRGVSVEQACLVCQRLVDRVAGADIATAMGPVRVTISSGVASIDGQGDSADASHGEAALAAADRALYAAKGSGRSRLASAA